MDFSAINKKEITKYMKEQHNLTQAHFSQTACAGIFSGPIVTCSSQTPIFSTAKYWINDTGATKC